MSNRRSLNFVSLLIASLVFAFSAMAVSAQVTVTGSTGADGPYTTLGAAFTALNAGTHTGNNIVVELSAGTTEAGSAILNSNAWTSLLIRPSVDGVVVAGPSLGGRGLIELNGADNVTIDGDNPNTGGINRNLTFQNTAASTTTYTSVIRLAVLAATQTSANNNTIRNSILLGSATGRNISTATSTTGSENTTFGVYAGGNGGAATPTAITSVTTNTAASGTTIDLLTVSNNEVRAAARGVVFNGAASSVSSGLTITNNLVGDQGTVGTTPPITSPTTTVYTKGLWVAGTNAATITGNSVKSILSYVGTTMAGIELNTAIGTGTVNISSNTVDGVIQNGASGARGIDINSSAAGATLSASSNTVTNIQTVNSTTIMAFRVSTTATAGTFEKNRVSGVNSRGASTFGAYGMSFEAGSNYAIRNNFISDVQHNMTGGSAFSTTFGVFGMRVAGGTGHTIYNNSVNLANAYAGTPASALLSAAFAIVGTGQTGLDVRNNIFVNTNSGGTTSIAHVAVYLPSSGTSAMNLTMNNNDYHSGGISGVHGVAHVGTTYTAIPAGPATFAGLYTQAAFDPPNTTPSSNFRAYTSTLSLAGTNDNASIKVDPEFVSSTDLHVLGTSFVLNAGATIGSVVDDIDGDVRPLEGTYDIGADERLTVVSPGQIQLTAAAYGGNEGASVLVTATRTGGTSGAVSVSFAMADISATGGAACGGSVDYINTGGTFNWGAGVGGSQNTLVTLCSDAVTDPAETFSFTISGPSGGATLGTPTVATLTITDVPPPFSGLYTVGGGGSYPSLTNSGGIFEAINLAGATGPITINVVSDLTGELGTHALNPIVGGHAVTIQPSGGVARSIIGSNSSTALIGFNGADNVTIDGLNTGGNTLLIRNEGTAPTVRYINDASTHFLRNSTIEGASSSAVVNISTGTTTGNDDIQIVNNTIRDRSDATGVPFNAVHTVGTNLLGNTNSNILVSNNQIFNFTQAGFLAGNSENITFTQNTIYQTAPRTTALFGIAVNSALGTNLFSQNVIRDLTTSVATTGIAVNDIRGGTVSRNWIYNFPSTSGSTSTLTGIIFNGGSGVPSAVSVENNFVSIIPAFANAQITRGILDFGFGGNTFTAFYNSVLLDGTATGAANSFACGRLNAAPTTFTMQNNVCFNNRTGGTGNHYAVSDQSANTGTFVSDFNMYVGTGATLANFYDYGTSSTGTPVSYGAWQTGPPTRDANSIQSNPGIGAFTVASTFVSPTNLRNILTSPGRNLGTPVAVTIDFDGQARPNPFDALVVQVDMGADEYYGPSSSAASAGGRVMTASGQGIRGAAIVVTGNSLPTPIIVKTGSLGYFLVDGLQTGETYVFTVVSKRFTFSQPSRVINMTDNISDLDFVSDPLE